MGRISRREDDKTTSDGTLMGIWFRYGCPDRIFLAVDRDELRLFNEGLLPNADRGFLQFWHLNSGAVATSWYAGP
jgi:hypothetical protein